MAFKMRGFKMVPDTTSSVSEDQAKSQLSTGTEQDQFISFTNPTQEMINSVIDPKHKEYLTKVKEYNDHKNNRPDGFFANVVHNLTGPKDPNMLGGGGGLDLIGGRGAARGALKAIKYLFKSGGKTYVKNKTK